MDGLAQAQEDTLQNTGMVSIHTMVFAVCLQDVMFILSTTGYFCGSTVKQNKGSYCRCLKIKKFLWLTASLKEWNVANPSHNLLVLRSCLSCTSFMWNDLSGWKMIEYTVVHKWVYENVIFFHHLSLKRMQRNGNYWELLLKQSVYGSFFWIFHFKINGKLFLKLN